MSKCPECGGTNIETFRMPYGPMLCKDCGFCVENKEEPGNPFIDDDPPAPLPSEPRPGLGEQMAAAMERKRKK